MVYSLVLLKAGLSDEDDPYESLRHKLYHILTFSLGLVTTIVMHVMYYHDFDADDGDSENGNGHCFCIYL